MRILKHPILAIFLLSSTLLLSACKSVEERAEEHFQSALSLISEGDVDRALVELRNAYNLDNGHIGARQTMGEIQLERGNVKGAYRQYLRLAEIYPDVLDNRITLAELSFVTSSWEELERHGAKAEELGPENPRVKVITLVRQYRSAVLEKDVPERRKLGAQADESLAAMPESALLHMTLMDNAFREQDFERALEETDWMIAYEPKNAQHYQQRLRALEQLGDTDAIEAQLRELITLFPDNPAHLLTLVRYFVSKTDLDAAEDVLRERVETADPEDITPTVDLITFLNIFREPDVVRAEIRDAISNRDDPIPFQIIEATFDFSHGERTKAISTLQDVLAQPEQSERTNQVKATLAKMLLVTGNAVGARTHIEEVLADEPTHPGALKMQAAWQIEADDTDAAIGGLRIALDQNPQDAEAMTLIASAYERAGQRELSRDFLAQSVEASGHAPTETLRYSRLLISEESYRPAEDILISALRIAPSNTNILITLGNLYLRMNDFGRAQGVVGALNRIGSDEAVQAANQIEAERLNRQHGQGRAMTFLEDLAYETDATLASKINFVRAKLRIGENADALALAQELEDSEPDNVALTIVLAVAQDANGDVDAAKELYRGLLDEQPNRTRIWRELSRLELKQGDRDAAKAAIDEGLKHAPQNADLLWAKASFLEQDGDTDSAIEIYQALYDQNSSSYIIANNLASHLAGTREDAESLEKAWIIARRLRDSDSPAINDTYGWILHRRGNSTEALSYLEKAAEGLPKDAIVQYHLGKVLVALDRPQDALDQFRKTVEIAGPEVTLPQVEDARTLIESLSTAAEQGN